jgi:YidC/Oxa1 family membrane protein insertase
MIAFLAVMIFLIGYQVVLKKYAPPPAQPTAAQQTQPASTPSPAPAVAAPAPSSPAPVKAVAKKKGKAGEKPEPAPAPSVQASAEAETVIENSLYKITFTNRGGQVKSWVLKNYKDDKGNLLDLIDTPAAQQFGYPLSLWTYDENLRKKLASVLYVTRKRDQGHPETHPDHPHLRILRRGYDGPQVIHL